MAVTVEFDADLTRVRAALDKLDADARAKTVNVSVGATASVGGAGGGPPSVAGVFGQIPASVGGMAGLSSFNFPNQLGSGRRVLTTSQVADIFGQDIAPPAAPIASLASPGFFGFGPTGMIPPTSAGGAMVPSGGGGGAIITPQGPVYIPPGGGGGRGVSGGGGGGGRGADRFLGLRTQGLSRYVGLGFLAHEALRVGQAFADRDEAYTLSGGDPLAQYKAEDTFERTLSGIPIVGQAASLASSAIANRMGFGSGGSAAIISDAEATDARTRGMGRRGALIAELRDRESVSSASDPYERRLRSAEAAHNKELRMIEERKTAQRDADEDSIKAYQKRLDADAKSEVFSRVVTPKNALRLLGASLGYDSGGIMDLYAGAEQDVANRNAGLIRGRRGELAAIRDRNAAQERDFADQEAGQKRAEIQRDRFFDSIERRVGIYGDVKSMALEAAGKFEESGRQDILTRQLERRVKANREQWDPSDKLLLPTLDKAEIDAYNAKIERQNRYAIEDETGDSLVSRAILNRDRQGRGFKQSSTGGKRALSGPISPALRSATESRFDAEIAVTTQQYQDEKELSLMALRGHGRVLDAAIAGGRFSEISGQSASIRERTALDVARLRKEKGNEDLIDQALANSKKEQELLANSFLNRFRADEFSVSRTALGGSEGGNAEMLAVLRQIADNTRDNVPRAQ